MSVKLTEQITNHLEFLGYKVEKELPQNKDEKELSIASHSRRNTIIYFEMFPGFILFQINLRTPKSHSIEMDGYINKSNTISNIARIYCFSTENEETSIRFEAIYMGDYLKETFGQFYDMLESDQQNFNSLENFAVIFLK